MTTALGRFYQLCRKGQVLSAKEEMSLLNSELLLTPPWQIASAMWSLVARQSPSHTLRQLRRQVKKDQLGAEFLPEYLLIEAICHHRLGHFIESLRSYSELSLLVSEEISARSFDVYLYWGQLYAWRGDKEQAYGKLVWALLIARNLEDDVCEALVWAELGRLHLAHFDFHESKIWLIKAYEKINLWKGSREALKLAKELAQAELENNQLSLCEYYLGVIDQASKELQDDYFSLSVESIRCLYLSRSGDQEAARRNLKKLWGLCNQEESWQKAYALLVQSEVLLPESPHQAVEDLNSAVGLFEQMDRPLFQWKCHILTAEAYGRVCRVDQASIALAKANGVALELRKAALVEATEEVRLRLDVPVSLCVEKSRVVTTGFSSRSSDYVELGCLGAGGFGEVLRVYDNIRGGEYAYKRFRLAGEYNNYRRQERIESLKVELTAASRLRHPGIVNVLAYGTEGDGTPYIVMPLVDGRNLREIVLKDEGDDISFIINVFSKIVHSLSYAHDNGVVHCDLKPDNIVVTESGPVILDFGSASLTLGEPQKNAIGTTAYMPIEQYMGRPISSKADVFALGVVLFELLTGRTPWEVSRQFNRLAHYKYLARAKKLLKLNGNKVLTEVCISMMSYSPQQRPTLQDVNKRLESF